MEEVSTSEAEMEKLEELLEQYSWDRECGRQNVSDEGERPRSFQVTSGPIYEQAAKMLGKRKRYLQLNEYEAGNGRTPRSTGIRRTPVNPGSYRRAAATGT